MGLETGTHINDLTITNPVGTDNKSQGDDHLRLIKKVVKASFPGMGGAAWRVQSKGSGYTVLATDNMSVIRCTTVVTLTLTAAATLGNQHMFVAFADGGIVTIDGNSSETVNGQTTHLVPDGAACIVICDGSNSFAITLPMGKDFRVEWKKGSDLSSASTLVMGDNGNFFDVTGTTTITAMTVPVGMLFMLQFDAALTLTDGSSLILPHNANQVTQAGDHLIGFATAANTVTILSYTHATAAAARTALGVAIGSDVQAYDADTLKADTDDTLSGGFQYTADADGTKTTGTYTPTYAGGNVKTATNGGAHTLAPQSGAGTIIIQYTNDGSAGSITTSGWDIVTGDSVTTTNGHDFMMYLTVVGSFQHLHIVALQ